MTDITSFPVIDEVLVKGGNTTTYTSGEALTAGQVIGIAASGTSKTIVAMDETSGEVPFGVVVHDQSSGDADCLTAEVGCHVKVANADDTTGIDAGGWVQTNDCAVKGTVSEFTPRADLASTVIDGSNDTTIDHHANIIGMAVEDIAGGSYGEIIIMPFLCLYSDHAVVS